MHVGAEVEDEAAGGRLHPREPGDAVTARFDLRIVEQQVTAGERPGVTVKVADACHCGVGVPVARTEAPVRMRHHRQAHVAPLDPVDAQPLGDLWQNL